MNTHVPTTASATNEAIDWMLSRSNGRYSNADQAAFDAWLAALPAHRDAWHRVSGVLAVPIAHLRHTREQHPGTAEAARRALFTAPDSRQRRRLLQAGAALMVVGGSSIIAFGGRAGPWAEFTAELRTGTAERRTHRLADGSELTLDANTTVDLRFNAGERRVRLLSGQLLAQAAPDARRPFIVETTHGTVRALGTRFLVHQGHEHSHVLVQEHAVRVQTASGAVQDLAEGESLRFSATQTQAIRRDEGHRSAWTHGLLDVRDESLGTVISALRPYLPGPVRVSPQAGHLRVFGVFRLDNPEQVLQALADTQPIDICRYGGWMTVIDAR